MSSVRPTIGGTVCETSTASSSGKKTAGRNFTVANFFGENPAVGWTAQIGSRLQRREYREYPQATGDGPL